jgi:hypothetical protein
MKSLTITIPPASAPGPATIPHNLGVTPTTIFIEMVGGGQIWFQPQIADTQNLYIVYSDVGVQGVAVLYYSPQSCPWNWTTP